MPCSTGGDHHYNWEEVKGLGQRLVCDKCGHISPHEPLPPYAELIRQNSILRKMLEDICECRGSLDELIDKARKLLQSL